MFECQRHHKRMSTHRNRMHCCAADSCMWPESNSPGLYGYRCGTNTVGGVLSTPGFCCNHLVGKITGIVGGQCLLHFPCRVRCHNTYNHWQTREAGNAMPFQQEKKQPWDWQYSLYSRCLQGLSAFPPVFSGNQHGIVAGIFGPAVGIKVIA